MVLRRRQQRDEGQERRQVEVAQAQARAGQPWQHPSPLQPWRVAQVVGSRYHMPVYSACPLDLHPGGNDADGDGDGTRKEKGGKGGCTGSGNDCDGCNMPQHQPGHHEGEVLLDVGTAGQGGDATASSGGGSTPTTSSSSSRRSRSSSNNSSSCSRGCSTQDLKASAGGGSAAQGGAGGCGGGLGATPGPAPLSGWEVCGWAGEGAMVCGLPQSGLDGRVDVRPVLVLQPHWQHPAQLHAAHPSPPVPLPLPPPPPQQQPPEVGSPPAPPQAQPEPEAQPAQLPPLQQEQQEPREAWADVASESEARCGDGGPEATEAASSPKHPHAP
ncbi:hypothetical protein HYH02_012188 [Chlamydomonas schloesseri]|uniref:Uncharacterized protein n=1 Tax=Chlamydomonas schloesseri TaxID=2026947 RepID=A0A835SZE1_9CHLO|nr:hypothetical protein HYH02_012188 [Chlamydomonas schloesseri]|eukprot:KAG2434521.1 hypothetical protein HYH02_012188 [Chlamydomonas schloesseri]